MAAIQVGDLAPDITLTTHDGQSIRLADYRGQRIVVLYFYPKDGTAVCTAEACAFRDAYEEFARAGAVVIGVSGDSLASHQEFASAKRLPFLLASDTDKGARRAFGVSQPLGFLPGRVTYVIDLEGRVRHIFSGLFVADRHVTEALAIVRQLTAPAG